MHFRSENSTVSGWEPYVLFPFISMEKRGGLYSWFPCISMEKLDELYLRFPCISMEKWDGLNSLCPFISMEILDKKIANIARPTSPLKWRAFFYTLSHPHLPTDPHTLKCCSTVKSGMASSTTYQNFKSIGHTFFSEKALILYAEIGLFKCASAIENLKTPPDVTSKNGLLAAWFRVVAQVIGKLALKRSYWA